MAGLSITRRRKAWVKGVVFGAMGRGTCPYTVEKLKEIFNNGSFHGKANAATSYVKSLIEQEQRKRAPQVEPQRPARFRHSARGESSRFDQPRSSAPTRFDQRPSHFGARQPPRSF